MSACFTPVQSRREWSTRGPEPVPPSPLGHLARLLREEERLWDEMCQFNARVEAACSYLSEPGCNADLGLILVGRLRVEFCRALARFRENRREIGSIFEADTSD